MLTRRAAGWGVVGAVLLGLGGSSEPTNGLSVRSACAEETIEPAARGETGSKLVGGKSSTALKASASREPAAASKPEKAAAKEPGKDAKPASKIDPAAEALAPLVADLRRTGSAADEQAAIAAAQKLGTMTAPAATDALLTELSTGLSPKVATAALDALIAQKPAAADLQMLPVLSLYARHRNAELRRRAVTALSALPDTTGSSQVVPQLISSLGDASAEVRQVAAQALGARHEKSAEPALIKLLLRKDPAAPAALGQVGGPDTARALSEMIGNVPDRMILETLGELLKRPDFGPEQVRVQVVKTIGKMPGSQTLDILSDYVKQTAAGASQGNTKVAAKTGAGKDAPRPSRVEALKIIEQRTAK